MKTKKGRFKTITPEQLAYWQTTYRELNPFMPIAHVCKVCGGTAHYRRDWQDSDRPYSYTEFKCNAGHIWQVTRIHD